MRYSKNLKLPAPPEDVNIMARKLALHWIAEDADRGISYESIVKSHHGGGRSHEHWHDDPDGFGGFDICIGGYYDLDTKTGLMRKKVPSTKVLVAEVYGVEGVWIFSIRELYQECKKGQLALL